jgi:hypothetical protein
MRELASDPDYQQTKRELEAMAEFRKKMVDPKKNGVATVRRPRIETPEYSEDVEVTTREELEARLAEKKGVISEPE